MGLGNCELSRDKMQIGDLLDRNAIALRISAGSKRQALAVVAEIVLFVYMSRVMAKVGAKRLLLVALGTTVLRWLLTVWGVGYRLASS